MIRENTHALDADWADVIESIGADYLFGIDVTGGIDDQQSFDQINDKLDSIQNSINVLSGKIDTAIDMLKALPAEISGILDAKFAGQWLVKVTGDLGNIRQHTYKYVDYEATRGLVAGQVDDLNTSIEGVWKNLGTGWSAAAATSGAIAAWLQFESMILADPVLNPVPPPMSDIDFVKRLQDRFVTVAAGTSQALRNATDLVMNTPTPVVVEHDPFHENWTFDESVNRFRRFNNWDGKTQVYWGHLTVALPHQPELWASVISPPGFVPVKDGGNFMDASNVIAADRAWPSLLAELPDAQEVLYTLKSSGSTLQRIGRALSIPALRDMPIEGWQNYITMNVA